MIALITNIFKSKRIYMPFLLMFSLCFLIILILVNTTQYYQHILESGIGTKIINRKLIVINNNEEVLHNIKNVSNVVDYYPYVYISGIFDETSFNLEYFSSCEYDLHEGKPINEKNEIVVPKELSDNINQLIGIKIDDTKYNLKVVGISNLKSIIISKELLNEIISSNDIKVEYYYLISENYKFAEETINYFSENGYSTFLENTDGLNEYTQLQKFISLLTKFMWFIIFVNFIFISYIIKNIFHVESKNIAILKAMGYTDVNICLVIISKILIILLISFIVPILIFVVIVNLLNYIFNIEYIMFSRRCGFVTNYCILCLCSILLLMINYIPLFFKIKKFNVVKILTDE